MGVANAEHFTTEDDFENWRHKLWPTLVEHFESQQTEEEKQISLKRKESLALIRSKKDSSILPWVCEEIEDVVEEEKSPNPEVVDDEIKHTYDMNMRNYQTSTDIPIKSIKELRQ